MQRNSLFLSILNNMKTMHTFNEEMEKKFDEIFAMSKWDTFGNLLQNRLFTNFITNSHKQLYIKIAEGELQRLEESLKRKEYKLATHFSPDSIETITIPDSYESAFHLGETINTKNSIQFWNNILQELNK